VIVDYLSVLRRIDELYESVVTEPELWGDAAFADWAEEVFASAEGIDKPEAREVRRCLRAAGKLQAFWSTDNATRPPDVGDWRTRVDIALGISAWRPTLAIAQIGLERAPSEELFDEVRVRFRVVNSEVWMEGIDYETWAAEQQSR
jgi:hypothetical protein